MLEHVRILIVAAALMLAACGKKEEAAPADELPPPVAEAEAERGRQACDAYVERLCKCAESRPDDADLADRCHMKKAKQSALRMAIQANRGDAKTSASERLKTEDTIRRIIAACIEENNALDAEGCPR